MHTVGAVVGAIMGASRVIVGAVERCAIRAVIRADKGAVRAALGSEKAPLLAMRMVASCAPLSEQTRAWRRRAPLSEGWGVAPCAPHSSTSWTPSHAPSRAP